MTSHFVACAPRARRRRVALIFGTVESTPAALRAGGDSRVGGRFQHGLVTLARASPTLVGYDETTDLGCAVLALDRGITRPGAGTRRRILRSGVAVHEQGSETARQQAGSAAH